MDDPYRVLGLNRGADEAEVREAYHQLCKQYHPDRLEHLHLPNDLRGIAKMRLTRVMDAYAVITKSWRQKPGNGTDL